MKGLSLAISSPVRPEKFPPPSRKFSRSRSSVSGPVFHIRGRRNAAGEIQEPNSPKVTCIGQVRPRKSGCRRRRRCWLWRKLLRRRVFGRFLCRWGAFFRSGYCKKVDAEEGCLRKMEALGGKFQNVLEIRGGDCRYRASSLGERFSRENLARGDAAAAVESSIREECSDSTRNINVNVSVGAKLEGLMVVHPLMLTRCKSEPAARIRKEV